MSVAANDIEKALATDTALLRDAHFVLVGS